MLLSQGLNKLPVGTNTTDGSFHKFTCDDMKNLEGFQHNKVLSADSTGAASSQPHSHQPSAKEMENMVYALTRARHVSDFSIIISWYVAKTMEIP